DLHTVRQANARNLTERRVWLLRRHRANLGTHTALLRGALAATTPTGIATSRVVRKLQRGCFGLLPYRLSPFSDQLIDRRHAVRIPPEVAHLMTATVASIAKHRRHLAVHSSRALYPHTTRPCSSHNVAVYRTRVQPVKQSHGA